MRWARLPLTKEEWTIERMVEGEVLEREGWRRAALPVATQTGVRDKQSRKDTREDTKALTVVHSCCERGRPLNVEEAPPTWFHPESPLSAGLSPMANHDPVGSSFVLFS